MPRTVCRIGSQIGKTIVFPQINTRININIKITINTKIEIIIAMAEQIELRMTELITIPIVTIISHKLQQATMSQAHRAPQQREILRIIIGLNRTDRDFSISRQRIKQRRHKLNTIWWTSQIFSQEPRAIERIPE